MNHATRKGFTIVELAIVIAVVGVLLSITMVAFRTVQAQSRDNDRRADAVVIKNALNSYYQTNGEYPNVCPSGVDSGCSVSYLVTPLTPFTKALPIADPDGGDYQYVRGPAYNSYAILIDFETSASCRTGQNMNAGWWGSISTCSNL